MVKPEDLTLDQLLYNAVSYLVQTGKQEAAELLLECELDSYSDEKDYADFFGEKALVGEYTAVTLSASASIKTILSNDPDLDIDDHGCEYPTNHKRTAITEAFQAVLRRSAVVIEIQLELATESEGDWREHLRQLAKGQKVTNQGRKMKPDEQIIVWKNLNLRSKGELRIAEALDRLDVLFFPNCAARLGPAEDRRNREPDFLICIDGKWGILEVDGKAFHQKTAAQQEEEDIQIGHYRIRVIRHFTGERCMKEPEEVVRIFLDDLKRNG